MSAPGLTADLCLKCNICTAACPVAAVTDLFPGPKAVGPQAQRYRHPSLPSPDLSVGWCSGCGTCSRVCPHGVAVAEINIQAKARLAEERRPPVRDHFLARPEFLGRVGSPFAPIANLALRLAPTRWLLERLLGINRHGPMPPFASRTLRRRERARCVADPPAPHNDRRLVAYFHGCSTNYYEPELGQKAIAVLEHLGCQVILPTQGCCGLPLQSNGFFSDARRYARSNVRWLAPFAERDIPIVGTSTSCTLALKHDYREILDIEGPQADALASGTFDMFEFLTTQLSVELKAARFSPLPARALYHPPCQLKSHFIGTPALKVLQQIPGLQVLLSESECCGIAGTYGMKHEKFAVAKAVGGSLFDQVREAEVDFVISDSETCRWWLVQHTGLPAYHPVDVLSRALGLS
jgi:glycerol-3-phosphate dehydrogenase subunit C